ncbi:MAG: hypothetical protein FJX02_14325 [Alphaproteobacteria bacterium]|nr:hypothetical protein [Alphaproteobacteria bacterium]
MRSNPVPVEFEDLLSAAGRRVLAGTHPLCGALADPKRRFVAARGLIDAGRAERLRRVLERELADQAEPLDRPIPPESIWDQTEAYADLLPKTVRARTIYFESGREPGVRVARRLGVERLLRSPSFHAFAVALAGRPLARDWGIQLLRYGPGDYAGPHHDHDPGNPQARGGYVDIHLGLCSRAVADQSLVYSKAGHFSEIVPLAGAATITAYRLPFWHYTTPLRPRRGRATEAQRWVMLGTFLYARSRPVSSSPRAPR